ncbi:MAG TPA: hypothetical protein DDW52_30100 [Planctomycetaceae bacterium]|nr:hypothetical protein [Planctomycetaceae bacterium]
MSIDLPEETTNTLSMLLGTSDPAAISQLIQRFADNESYVQALMLEAPTEDEIARSVEMFQRSEREIDSTGGHDFEQAIHKIASKYDLDLGQ